MSKANLEIALRKANLEIALAEARAAQCPQNIARLEQYEATIDALVGVMTWCDQRYRLVWPNSVLSIWPHPGRKGK